MSVLPLIAARTNATDGEIRRVALGDTQALAEAILSWMTSGGVLVGTGGEPALVQLQDDTVLGRRQGGGVAALGRPDLDALLGLPARLDALAPLVHVHQFQAAIADIDWSTLANGTRLGYEGGVFRWEPKGSGSVANPLGEDLDIADRRIVSGSDELIRFEGGKIYLGEREIFDATVTAPEEGHSLYYDGTAEEFRNDFLRAAFVVYDREGGGQVQLQAMIDAILGSLDNRALLLHSHMLGEIQGGTPGKYVRFDDAGVLEEVDGPSGGGALDRPLEQDLDIAEFRIVSDGVELMRFDQGQLFLRGLAVFASRIESPEKGQVPVYDDDEGEFRNGLIGADSLAADLRCLQFDGANYLLPDLPKTDPGVVNALWSDAGTLRISSGIT